MKRTKLCELSSQKVRRLGQSSSSEWVWIVQKLFRIKVGAALLSSLIWLRILVQANFLQHCKSLVYSIQYLGVLFENWPVKHLFILCIFSGHHNKYSGRERSAATVSLHQCHSVSVWNRSQYSENRWYCKYKLYQGAKKVIFRACHSGKLKLACTSPNVISTSPKNILMSRIDFTVLL